MNSTQHLVLIADGATGSGVRLFEVLPPLVETAMTTGRGKGKITPTQLADEFWKNFTTDRCEMLIGKIRSPTVLDAIFKLLRR